MNRYVCMVFLLLHVHMHSMQHDTSDVIAATHVKISKYQTAMDPEVGHAVTFCKPKDILFHLWSDPVKNKIQKLKQNAQHYFIVYGFEEVCICIKGGPFNVVKWRNALEKAGFSDIQMSVDLLQ